MNHNTSRKALQAKKTDASDSYQFDMLSDIFDGIDPNDSKGNRPLPELIADGGENWKAFPLQMQDVDGVQYYAVRDWIIGISFTNDPGNLWKRLRKRIEATSEGWGAMMAPHPYRDAQGKIRDVPYATAEGLYLITQRMDTNTGIRDKVLRYLASAGVTLDEVRIDPDKVADLVGADKAAGAAVKRMQKDGKSQSYIKDRLEGIAERKHISKVEQDTHVTHTPDYRGLTLRTYEELLGMSMSEIVRTLNLNRAQVAQFRDNLNQLAIQALRSAETAAAMRMEKLGRLLTDSEQMEIIVSVSRMLAPGFHRTAEYIGIDLATGRPLLKP